MKKAVIWLVVVILGLIILGNLSEDKLDVEKQTKIIDAVSSGLVVVEYTLCYDDGQPPASVNVSYICPGCGSTHTRQVGDKLIKEERPLEEAGFLLAKTMVVTRDTTLEPRFIKAIQVRYGDKLVNARIASYAIDQNAIFLELDEQLEGTKPIEFKDTGSKSYSVVNYSQMDTVWSTTLKPLSESVSISRNSKKFVVVPPQSLAVDKDGTAVGLIMNSEQPPDNSWKGSPLNWDVISAAKLAAKLEELEKVTNETLLTGLLNFRSPKTKPGSSSSFSSRSYSSSSYKRVNKDTTEERGLCINIGKQQSLMLLELPRITTARLEQVRVSAVGGEPHDGAFVGSMKDYGVLVVSIEKPLGVEAKFAKTDILDLKNKLLLSASIQTEGDQRIAHFSHARVIGYTTGKENMIYPIFNGYSKNSFFFNLENELVFIPVSERKKVSLRGTSSSSWSSAAPVSISASRMAEMKDDLLAQYDLNNVPVGEDEEDQTAWMGAVFQALNRDLARENKCSEQTNYGATGGLVTFVYPDSPAEKAGVMPGMILLRLIVEGEPKPIDVKISTTSSSRSFSWDQMDRMSASSLDRMRPPWPEVKDSFNVLLTEIGFGRKYTAEFLHEGKEFSKDLVITQSPEHYASAKKYKSEPMGITVRNLTFEVRRYLQKESKDPGVIVSKIERGSKASVAGIKPFEVITHIGGKPVMNVEEFSEMLSTGDEQAFSIDRMSQTRQVLVKQGNGEGEG